MRLSRGRSTPMRRAIRQCFLLFRGGLFPVRSRFPEGLDRGPASVPGVMSGLSTQWCWDVCIQLCVLRGDLRRGLALALLVARVRADDHDTPMPADHPAL